MIIQSIGKDVVMLTDIARVSRSGYYQWLKTSHKPDRDYKDYLTIKEVFNEGNGRYGFRTICMKLKADRGITMNHKKVLRIMHTYNLVTKIRKANPYKQIMKRALNHRTFDNKLNREFVQYTPRTYFCTDITYVFFSGKAAYLSVIKDIASGEVISWELSRRIDMELVLATVNTMEKNLRSFNLEGITIHSDQGFHYTNPAYINKIKDLGMIQSMSRKGNCSDNAPIESFFGHLKDHVDHGSCKTFDELRQMIADYMYYYNNQRYQWGLEKMTPVQYRDHLLMA